MRHSRMFFWKLIWRHFLFSLTWREVKKRFWSNLLELGTFKWKCGDYICEPTQLSDQMKTYQLSSKNNRICILFMYLSILCWLFVCWYFYLPPPSFHHPSTHNNFQNYSYHYIATTSSSFSFSLSSREFVCWHQKAADSEQEGAAAVQVWTASIIQLCLFVFLY